MSHPIVYLRQLVARHFNLEELRTLCFDLSVNYHELGGEGLSAKARELPAYLDRRLKWPISVRTLRGES
jgi:hypothetical protein